MSNIKQQLKDIIEKMAKESITCGWADQETGTFYDLDNEFKKIIKEHPEYAELDRKINPIMQYGYNIGLTQESPFHNAPGCGRFGDDKEGEQYKIHQAEEMDKVFDYIDSI